MSTSGTERDRTAHADYRHRTSDLWEATFLWSKRYPLSHTEHDGGRVFFCFPDAPGLLDDLRDYQLGEALVNPTALRHGYYQMRQAMDAELGDAGRP